MKRLLFLFAIIPSILIAQRSIKGKFVPSEEFKAVVLYRITPDISKYVSSSELGKNGEFNFKLDSTATKGMYRIVYGLPQEDFNFDVIYSGKEDVDLVFNSETGVEFLKSSENKVLATYTSSMAKVSQAIGNFYNSKSKDSTALLKIFDTQRKAQLEFEDIAKNTIAFNFIKANKPYIPSKFEDIKTYIKNLEKHYFDHIDFNNKVLQSSSFLEQRMLNFIFGRETGAESDLENYKKNIDVFMMKAKNAPDKVKINLLSTLWQQMVDLEAHSVVNYISETYLMDLAVVNKDQNLLKVLKVYKNTSIGNVAPDFSYDVLKDGNKLTRKLSELNEIENYLLVFWSTTCSHCLDEIPQLHAFAKTFDKNQLKVLAIALEDEQTSWKTSIKNLTRFTNIYGKGKWDNEISKSYGVNATPTYFVLNKDKLIVAKPEDVDGVKAFFVK